MPSLSFYRLIWSRNWMNFCTQVLVSIFFFLAKCCTNRMLRRKLKWKQRQGCTQTEDVTSYFIFSGNILASFSPVFLFSGFLSNENKLHPCSPYTLPKSMLSFDWEARQAAAFVKHSENIVLHIPARAAMSTSLPNHSHSWFMKHLLKLMGNLYV